MKMKSITGDLSIEQARELGQQGIEASSSRASQSGFSSIAASKVIMDHLTNHGQTPGEDLVLIAKRAGHVPPDDRAFGSVFSTLSRRKEIQCVGYCNRRRGHGTAGGRIWDRV